jgi:hypothetical protein
VFLRLREDEPLGDTSDRTLTAGRGGSQPSPPDADEVL